MASISAPGRSPLHRAMQPVLADPPSLEELRSTLNALIAVDDSPRVAKSMNEIRSCASEILRGGSSSGISARSFLERRVDEDRVQRLPSAESRGTSEPIRSEVELFVATAPLPASEHADQEHMERLTDLLMNISAPVSREEAIHLAAAFGPDDCFGLARTLLHLIESAPGGAPLDAITESENEWILRLRARQDRSSAGAV
jgi:hypothetical protein